jgi:hypothetical protein
MQLTWSEKILAADSYNASTCKETTLFSGHYLRNRSSLDIAVLGYIGILYPKEHPPEVWHIPSGTPCLNICCYFVHEEEDIFDLRHSAFMFCLVCFQLTSGGIGNVFCRYACEHIPHKRARLCSVLISFQTVTGTGHDCREVSRVYSPSACVLLPHTVASVETVLRGRYGRQDDGAAQEQSGHSRVEQVQCCEEHHCGLQTALWAHCSGILPQSVLTLWPSVLRNSFSSCSLQLFSHIQGHAQVRTHPPVMTLLC